MAYTRDGSETRITKRLEGLIGVYDMKKAIAILLVLLVAGVAFGATSNDLVVNTTVNELEGLKLSSTALTTLTAWNDETDIDEALTFTSTDAEIVPDAASFFINLRTNKKNSYTVGLSGLPLASETEGVTSKIGYVITAGTNTFTVASTATAAVGPTTIATFVAGNGMRYQSEEATVTLDSTSWMAATADSGYTATITVSITEGATL
jgi:hypothetical protein